jgi:hypothetical protein
MIMDFIRWFKGSLEDDKGVASFRRIYNWIIISLVAFLVVYVTVKNIWTTVLIDVLIVLLVAGFLNTSVITADNVLRFFNRDKSQPDKPPEQPQNQTTKLGDIPVILTDQKNDNNK